MTEISITIIEKFDTHTIVECARCDGSGQMEDEFINEKGMPGSGRWEEETCTVCGGEGAVKLTATPPFYECPNCEGSGRTTEVRDGLTIERAIKHTCSACDGTGIKQTDDLEEY